MSHSDEEIAGIPTHLTYVPPAGSGGGGMEDRISLLVRGQGTIAFAIHESRPFEVATRTGATGTPGGFAWRIEAGVAVLRERQGEAWSEVARFAGVGLDPATDCPYWFSFDCHNRALLYGKGEMRLGTMLAAHRLPPVEEHEDDPHAWIAAIDAIATDAAIAGEADIWRDPVTQEPPMRVVPDDAITMEDIARGRVTSAANLTPTCQQLYRNVAGAAFILDTPDFPDFSRAIKASIADPNGWCARTLDAKSGEFGDKDRTATYLRITLGTNQGESPGIPYVMEIWPSGNHSPIHNHGGSDAVIRVLHGEITVHMYPWLSPEHLKEFGTKVFATGDVTWISARLNQVHKLENANPAEPCITIQCYLYEDSNRTHWPYFDYLGKNGIAHFSPNSDAEFLDFKERMKKEWAAR
jgi:Cysteine dioxygenase type I